MCVKILAILRNPVSSSYRVIVASLPLYVYLILESCSHIVQRLSGHLYRCFFLTMPDFHPPTCPTILTLFHLLFIQLFFPLYYLIDMMCNPEILKGLIAKATVAETIKNVTILEMNELLLHRNKSCC